MNTEHHEVISYHTYWKSTGVDPLGTGGTRVPKVRVGGTPMASSPQS